MKTAVCLITKAYLLVDVEFWIDHYLNYCGFDHVFLYDNESYCGSLKELLKPDDRVTIDSFTDEYKLSKLHIQQDIYEDLYMKIRKEYDWLLCVDDDEYLWINKEKYKDIKAFLEDMYSHGKKQICFPWQIMSYEDNHVPVDRYKPAPMECFYTYYTFYRHKKQLVKVKSIFNCKELNIRICNIHSWANVEHNFYTEFEKIDDMYSVAVNMDVFACNVKIMHYRRRSYKEWDLRINRNGIDWPQELYRNRLIEFDETDQMPKGFTVYDDPFKLDKQG